MYDEKFLISVEETACYEIWAKDKEEALARFEAGDGDFIGYDETRERETRVERFERSDTPSW